MHVLQTLRFGRTLKSKCYGLLSLQSRSPSSLVIWKCNNGTGVNYSHQLLHSKHCSVNAFTNSHCLSVLVNKYGTKSNKSPIQENATKNNKASVQESEANSDGTIQEDDNFKLVYFINHLHKIRFISLLKVYQTVFVFGSLPLMIYKWNMSKMTGAALLSYGGVMVFSTAMLYVIAAYFTSIVCAMYVDKKAKQVKISHLTFRARRKNLILDIQDIVPVFEINPDRRDLYYHVNTYDNKHKFKLFLGFGTIHDQKAMVELLGKIL